MSRYKKEVIEALEEAKKISHDPNTKRYGSFAEALNDLDDDEKSVCDKKLK